MKKEEAEVLWPIIKAFSEDKTIQLRDKEGDWFNACLDVGISVFFDVEACRIKPEEVMVDVSVLVESGIDCEFSDYPDFENAVVGQLVSIYKGLHNKHPFKRTIGTEDRYTYARPRMNHLHAWTGGDCPLPRGLLVDVVFREGSPIKGRSYTGLQWHHGGVNRDIIAFKVVGLEDGYVYA